MTIESLRDLRWVEGDSGLHFDLRPPVDSVELVAAGYCNFDYPGAMCAVSTLRRCCLRQNPAERTSPRWRTWEMGLDLHRPVGKRPGVNCSCGQGQTWAVPEQIETDLHWMAH